MSLRLIRKLTVNHTFQKDREGLLAALVVAAVLSTSDRDLKTSNRTTSDTSGVNHHSDHVEAGTINLIEQRPERSFRVRTETEYWFYACPSFTVYIATMWGGLLCVSHALGSERYIGGGYIVFAALQVFQPDVPRHWTSFVRTVLSVARFLQAGMGRARRSGVVLEEDEDEIDSVGYSNANQASIPSQTPPSIKSRILRHSAFISLFVMVTILIVTYGLAHFVPEKFVFGVSMAILSLYTIWAMRACLFYTAFVVKGMESEKRRVQRAVKRAEDVFGSVCVVSSATPSASACASASARKEDVNASGLSTGAGDEPVAFTIPRQVWRFLDGSVNEAGMDLGGKTMKIQRTRSTGNVQRQGQGRGGGGGGAETSIIVERNVQMATVGDLAEKQEAANMNPAVQWRVSVQAVKAAEAGDGQVSGKSMVEDVVDLPREFGCNARVWEEFRTVFGSAILVQAKGDGSKSRIDEERSVHAASEVDLISL